MRVIEKPVDEVKLYQHLLAKKLGAKVEFVETTWGNAVLDLHKAKAPRLSKVDGAGNPGEMLGHAGYLTSSLTRVEAVAPQPRNVELVETKGTPRTRTARCTSRSRRGARARRRRSAARTNGSRR